MNYAIKESRLILRSGLGNKIYLVVSGSNLKYQNLGETIIQTYPNDQFYGHGTNWSIQQHSNGMIFVSNDEFHIFDGANWRTHHLQDNSSIRHLS